MATNAEEPKETSVDHGVQKQSASEEGNALSNGAAAQLDEGEMSLQVDFSVLRCSDQQNPVRQYAWAQRPRPWMVAALSVALYIAIVTSAGCLRAVAAVIVPNI